ncbi:MAG: translation initiation factor IF-3 [Patescibacteria group bacterium]
MNILVIDEEGNKIGEMSLEVAKKMASDVGKSLIIINPKANVYRIADAGKLKYEQKQKVKDQRAQKRTHKVKEIKFGLTTEQHDVDIKIRRVREFLEKGLKTKITVELHGRQETFKDHGFEKIKNIIEASILGGLATISRGPTLEGRNIVAFLAPTK